MIEMMFLDLQKIKWRFGWKTCLIWITSNRRFCIKIVSFFFVNERHIRAFTIIDHNVFAGHSFWVNAKEDVQNIEFRRQNINISQGIPSLIHDIMNSRHEFTINFLSCFPNEA